MLLLDTSVVLGIVLDLPRVGPQTRRRLDADTSVHVSAVSLAEMVIKSMIGKLVVPDRLAQAVREQGFIELPVTAEHAEAIRNFPELARHDPFDRLLVAQAYCTGMSLLTADRVLLGLERDFILDATA
jgi:PIN domain nuclease of toxin-antitoxin system